MKAYVIKDKETGEYQIYDEARMLFSKYLFKADIFWDYETTIIDCPSFCEVVEITIAEGNLEKQLAEREKTIKEINKAYIETYKREREKDKENEVLRKALELACEHITDAIEMLRSAGKQDWAGVLDDNADYFIQQAKESMNEQV